jgi:ribosomal protein S18 acetylase RimI-like enzyme
MRLPARFAAYSPRSKESARPARRPIRAKPAAEPQIVTASAADLDAIARITFEREGGTYDQARQRAARWFADAKADAAHNLLLIARAGRAVAGYARAGFVPGKKSDEYDVPDGWYLGGIVVAKAFRRRGIGTLLTRRRVEWLSGERGAREVFYFVNSLNRASIDLHTPFGFVEVRRDFRFPGATFSGGGSGVLFRAELKTEGNHNAL